MRRPTGNLSWMMRIQNDQDPAEAFLDFSLSDISRIFMSTPDDSYDYMQRRKIDSMTLGENEYDHLLEEHFQSDTSEGKHSTATLCHLYCKHRCYVDFACKVGLLHIVCNFLLVKLIKHRI